MADIFLSYRREDSAGYAGRLYDDLATQFGDGVVFRDVDTLAPGVDFDETIRTTISGCKSLLVVIGRDWMTKRGGRRRIDDPRDYVRVEVETALRGGIPVIPVLVGRATMPSPTDLPPSLQALSTRNAIELDDSRWKFDLGRLVASLESSVSPQTRIPTASAEAEPAPTVVVPRPPTDRRRKAVLVAAGTATALVVVVGLLVTVAGGSGPTASPRTTETSLVPTTTTMSLPAEPGAPATTIPSGPHVQANPGPAVVQPQPPATGRPEGTSRPPTSPQVDLPPPTPTTIPSPPPAVVPPAPAKLKVSPSSGAPGTVVTVEGAACPRPDGWTGGQVYWGINYSKTGEDVVVRELDQVPGSGWVDKVELPVKLYAGSYGVWANCFAWNAAAGTWSRFYDYVTAEFSVT